MFFLAELAVSGGAAYEVMKWSWNMHEALRSDVESAATAAASAVVAAGATEAVYIAAALPGVDFGVALLGTK